MQGRSERATIWLTAAVLAPFAGLLAFHAAQYLPFLSDDALISLRYARRLIDGGGLTWTDGRPVEGYSNLLWILLVAAAGWIGADLIEAARIAGVACSVVTLAALAWWNLQRARLRLAWLSLLTGLATLALSQPLAAWAIGGLEQPLLCALLAASIPLAFRVVDRARDEFLAASWLAAALGLLCLTRPDGALFAAVSGVVIAATGWLSGRPGWFRHTATAMAGPALCVGGQLAFRLAYYGEWVPNTALVKIAGTSAHRNFGLEYVSSGFWAFWPVSGLAIVSLVVLLVSRQARRRGALLGALTLAWTAYVVFIGGDIFPAYRHLTPLVVLSAFAISETAFLMTTALAGRRIPLAAVATAVVAAMVPYWRAQADDKWVKRAMTERWEWQARELALLLKSAFSDQQPLIAVTAAGSLPYWSELPALDMMGLSDYYLPRHRPADFGQGMVGHELGNGRYVLDQKPDLIIFDVGSPSPSWRTGDELRALPEFHERYRPVTVRTEPSNYTATLFVAKDSSRIGIRRSGDRIEIPAFLFADEETVARGTAAGTLAVRLTPGHEVSLEFNVEPGSTWGVEGGQAGTFEAQLVQKGATLSVTLRPASASVEIERLVLLAGGR